MDKFFPTVPIDLTLVGIQKGEQRIDVKKMVESVAIYESIKSDSVSAAITIRDGLDILSSIPIDGGETVYIEWRMTGKDVFNKDEFIVYKVSGQTYDYDAGVQIYTLNLISKDKMIDVGLSIQKAYTGTYSEIARVVLENKLGTLKGIQTSDTLGSFTVHPANKSPLEFCSWLAKRSVNVSMTPFYFYSTRNGYSFVDYTSMSKQVEKAHYTYNPLLSTGKQINPDAIEDHYFNIQAIRILDSQDRLAQTANGVFEEIFHTFDVQKKRATDTTFTTANVKARLNAETPSDPFNGKRSKHRFALTRSDGSEKVLPSKNAIENLLMENRLEIEVIGNDDLVAGDVIHIDIPVVEPRHSGVTFSPALSGRYLIHDIAHIFNGSTYVTQMMVVKDSRG